MYVCISSGINIAFRISLFTVRYRDIFLVFLPTVKHLK